MALSNRERMRLRRKKRIRKKITGTPERPRLTVYRSLRHIYAQVIDDTTGRTIASASTHSKEIRELPPLPKSEIAKKVGSLISKRCGDAGIQQVVFDRNGFIYHGRILALAEAAREDGLKF